MNREIHNDHERRDIVITYPFPLGHADGGARHTREIARHLGMLGSNVTIIAVSRGAGPRQRFPRSQVDESALGREFDNELSASSVEIIRIPQNTLHWRLDGLAVKKALKSLIRRRGRPDIVLSFFNEGAALGPFLKSQDIRFGYIAAWQSYAMALKPGMNATGIGGMIQRRLDRQGVLEPYQQADIIFANSEFTRGELQEFVGVDPKKIVISYLGVDDSFTTVPIHRPTKVNRLLFVGRIRETKGIVDAMEALGKLAAEGVDDWTFRVVGGAGEFGMTLAKNAALRHGVADKVEFCGEMDDAGMRKELEQAHVAIMPSHAESFGLAIAEAQAAGVPVVAYHVAAVPEVVDNGVTGWLAPFRQSDQLSACIRRAIEDPEVTYSFGLAARQRVQQNFTWPATATRILEGIQTIS